MKSLIVKHSIAIDRRRTTVAIETAFWAALKEIAKERGVTLITLVSTVKAEQKGSNLASTLRVLVLDHYRRLEKGAARAPNWPFIE